MDDPDIRESGAAAPASPSFGHSEGGTGDGTGGQGAGAGSDVAAAARHVVRIAGLEDAAALALVADATFPLACPPHTTPDAIADFIERNLSQASFEQYLADPQRVLHVAEADGSVIGYAMTIVAEPTDADVDAAVRIRPTAEISKVYVLPDRHGSGVARDLIRSAFDAAAARGARSVWLGVNQLNERANAFYEKHGFAKVGQKRFLVGDRYEHDFVRLREVVPGFDGGSA